jgi:hypothetical protein
MKRKEVERGAERKGEGIKQGGNRGHGRKSANGNVCYARCGKQGKSQDVKGRRCVWGGNTRMIEVRH